MKKENLDFTVMEIKANNDLQLNVKVINETHEQSLSVSEYFNSLDELLKKKNSVFVYVLGLEQFLEILNDPKHQISDVFIWDEQFEYRNNLYLLKLRRKKNTKIAAYFKDYFNFFTESPILNLTLNHKYDLLKVIIKNTYENFALNVNTHTILSLASISNNIFKKNFEDKAKLIPEFDSVLDAYIRPSFFGGRTEIYTPIVEDTPIYYYDVNSLYPFVMKTMQYPIGYPVFYNADYFKSKNFNLNNVMGFLRIKIYHKPSNDHLPVLPMRCPQLDNNIIYPDGYIDGVYFTEEIKLALENGYELKEIYDGYLYENKNFIFDAFVDTIYGFRMHYKQQKNPILNIFYKLVLNSLYGRFSCVYDKEYNYDILYEAEENKDESFKYKYVNIGIASAIASYARIFMYNQFKSFNIIKNLIYWDTDGFFITKRLPSDSVDLSRLGAFRLEDNISHCYFVSTKFYMYLQDFTGKKIFVLRSVKQLGTISYHLFITNLLLSLDKYQLSNNICFTLHHIINNNKEIKKTEFTFVNKRVITYSYKYKKYLTRPYIRTDKGIIS